MDSSNHSFVYRTVGLYLEVGHYYFNSLSLLEKFPVSSISVVTKENILSRNANLPVEFVIQIAQPRNTCLPSSIVFPPCRKV